MPSRYASIIAFTLFLAGSGFALPAQAESDARVAEAEAKFNAGRKLVVEGHLEEACAEFEASLRIVDGLGTRYNLADCEERRKNFARAHALFLAVAEQAKAAGQTEREREARARSVALDSRLSRLTVELSVPSVEFELDGKPVNEEALSEPVLVEPGRHRVSARREGRRPWSSEITVPRAGLYVIVKVPPLVESSDVSGSREARQVGERSTPATKEAAPSAQHADRARTARNVAIVLGGVGVGALIAGTTFGLQYLSSNGDAEDICPTGENCTQEDISQHQRFVDDTRSKRTWAYVGLGAGALALGSAALVYFALGQDSGLSASTGLNSDGSWNLALHGKF